MPFKITEMPFIQLQSFLNDLKVELKIPVLDLNECDKR